MSEILMLSNCRLSFPALVEPKASAEGSKPKYSADLLIPVNSPDVQRFATQYAKIATEKWGEHANAVMQMIQGDRKVRCFGKGEEKINKKTFQPYNGYEGMVYISANSDRQPQMIRLDGSGADPANTLECQTLARKLYGGCYVNVAIRPWLQDNKHGRGVRCELIAIQFANDGGAFGEGTADASNLFGAVAGAAPVTGFGAAVAGGLPSFLG